MTAPKTEKKPDEMVEQEQTDGASRAIDPVLLAALTSQHGQVDPVLVAGPRTAARPRGPCPGGPAAAGIAGLAPGPGSSASPPVDPLLLAVLASPPGPAAPPPPAVPAAPVDPLLMAALTSRQAPAAPTAGSGQRPTAAAGAAGTGRTRAPLLMRALAGEVGVPPGPTDTAVTLTHRLTPG